MSQANPHRGGAPVGYLAELPEVEERAVMCLRRWHTDAWERRRVCSDFGQFLGNEQGLSAVESLEQICELCTRYGRRPLMRHQVDCKCLGADEACFANFIGAAADGEREDAMLMATLLIRHDFAPSLVGLAENLGLALKRISARDNTPMYSIKPHSNSLH